MMDQQSHDELQRLLTKDVLKSNLAKAGLFLLAYEALAHSIVQKPKNFFTGHGVPDDNYKNQVLALYPESEFIASCKWLETHGVLTPDDIKEIRALRKHRTVIAHEPINIVLDAKSQVDEKHLLTLYRLLVRIDQWWISEFEIPINSDFDGEEIDPSGIQSGMMVLLRYVISTVFDVEVT
jgi:hypothetical protein